MTVRNWLELLVVQLVLVGIGLLFEMQQQSREERRAEADRELAEQRAQDEALQAYLNQMNTLLLEEDLRNSEEGSEVRTLARARTLTVLGRLDPSRRTDAMRFLMEADLVQGVDSEKDPILGLSSANLSGADLRSAFLDDADLSDTNLSGAENVAQEELSQAKSLEGATMPNGQKYEDWLKSRGEDGENE